MKRIINRLYAITLLSLSLAGCIVDHAALQHSRDGYYRNSITTPTQIVYFSFKIPQYPDPYEFSKMDTWHRQDASGAYVSFGPAGFDHTIYSIAVGPKKKSLAFDSADTFAARWQQQLFHKRHGKPPQKILQRRTKILGHPALYSVYSQYVQEQKGLYYRSEAQTLTYMAYTIDYGNYLVFIQAQGASAGEINAISPEDRKLIRGGQWRPLKQLINSFSLMTKPAGPLN